MFFLGSFKKSPPPTTSRWTSLLNRVCEYLMARSQNDQDFEFRPPILAEALGESELAILAAFRALQDQEVAVPHFGLYCGKEHLPMEVFDSLEDVPDHFECPHCFGEHDIHSQEMYVELFFTVNRSKLLERQRVAA